MFRSWLTKSVHKDSLIVDMGRLAASTLDIDQVYQQLSEIVSRILQFDQLVITDIDAKRDVRSSCIIGIKMEYVRWTRKFGQVVK